MKNNEIGQTIFRHLAHKYEDILFRYGGSSNLDVIAFIHPATINVGVGIVFSGQRISIGLNMADYKTAELDYINGTIIDNRGCYTHKYPVFVDDIANPECIANLERWIESQG